MHVSVLDLFSIGIGPSSSHTVGPMKAACSFIQALADKQLIAQTENVRCDLYGSLAATGKGHGTDMALIFGFMSEMPDTVDVATMDSRLDTLKSENKISLPGGKSIHFDPKRDLDFHRHQPLPLHPNGMHFSARDASNNVIFEEIIYSMGGGFISSEEELKNPQPDATQTAGPHPFDSADDLLEIADSLGCDLSEIMLANENAIRPEKQTRAALDQIWATMQECVENGIANKGTLPGGLKVKRRAHTVYQQLTTRAESTLSDPLSVLDWVGLYALAVNEENAGHGRVVTAPTNGAAGIIPAVLHYATRFKQSPHKDGIHRFLLTAGAIANLYKKNASISGADVGCQGEVGVACSMAAGALVEFLGGSPAQVENAAEIGMEHNLGLTCDPIGGLVQIPCIERNAMASVKAINAARMAMNGDGSHFVSLDKVIKTMRDTGRDMQEKYKETARGGLAVNVVEC
ncbi:L-serine ammonia-lyase [Rubritalea tangerina]|uniref:L-serine dehydratase n=1 Tax=Rubritalea tangerina TaxID=430798 RepID=A0ABW4Z7G8_9BACT